MKKNRAILILMISSIVLLLALQAFWLTSSYERAFFDLRRESNGLFRSSIIALRDSTLSRQFIEIKTDTQKIRGNILLSGATDSIKGKEVLKPSTSSQIKIYISSERKGGDSIKSFFSPLASRIREGRFQRGENFIFRMNDDSLSIDSVKAHFEKAISTTREPINFHIRYSSFIPTPSSFHPGKNLFKRNEMEREVGRISPFSDSLSTEWVSSDPIHRYAAVLTDFRSILLKAIFPQILFSLFLTLITITSFVILHRSLRSQQRLVVMKNDFISNITHEIKTPIATVSVALEALKNFNGIDNPVRTKEYLEIAQHELQRLSILTDKVLHTSIFDEKGVKLELETVDLEKTMSDILNSMNLLAEKNNSTIEFQKSGSDFTIEGSQVHLTNVIYNLIDNALKYSPVKPELNISLKDLGENIQFSITDKGLGIAKEFHEKIFEKFFRTPTGNVHTIKGYGLGLSYVEGVVKAHHGKISVESELGKGSTFTVTLPRKFKG
ncbi:MAG: HAMP domain-containing histidine kinase [Cyclobacteriaceae bacterium]|nr:HAMP domain-containing histidine kinase [Cyclobacteriaceae bacterium]